MRLLHISPTYVPAYRYGGPIYSAHGLCKALVADGHEVAVYTTNVHREHDLDVPLETIVDVDGVQVSYFACDRSRRLYWSSSLDRRIRDTVSDFDLAHLHALFLRPTWCGARAARRQDIPFVVTPRGVLVRELFARKSKWIKELWFRGVDRRSLQDAAAVHFTTPVEAAEAHKFGLRLKREIIVPNGVEPGWLQACDLAMRSNPRPADSAFRLLFIGRISWKKGLDRLIRALARVPGASLEIAGYDEEGHRGQLERLAGEQGVLERTEFLGPVYGQEKAELMAGASLFILPSYSENFGNVVIESMAAGCPAVVTPEVGLSDMIVETGSGMVVEGDPEAMAKGITGLLADSARRQAMGTRARQVVEQRFLWPRIAREMETAYREIISGV